MNIGRVGYIEILWFFRNSQISLRIGGCDRGNIQSQNVLIGLVGNINQSIFLMTVSRRTRHCCRVGAIIHRSGVRIIIRVINNFPLLGTMLCNYIGGRIGAVVIIGIPIFCKNFSSHRFQLHHKSVLSNIPHWHKFQKRRCLAIFYYYKGSIFRVIWIFLQKGAAASQSGIPHRSGSCAVGIHQFDRSHIDPILDRRCKPSDFT